MSKKAVMFRPSYTLHTEGPELNEAQYLFKHGGIFYVAKDPFFGTTETVKAAMNWAHWRLPPVMLVRHEKPSTPDTSAFIDPNCNYRHCTPYAMSIAELQCLGENKARRIKIYFCDEDLHENGTHIRSKGVQVRVLV